MIASQRAAAYQQQRAHIEHSDVSFSAAPPAAAPVVETTPAPAVGTVTTSSSTTAAPSSTDLRTIQLRVMCRQRGLDSTGTEAELLQRLNAAVVNAAPATASTTSAPATAATGPVKMPASVRNTQIDDSEDEEEQKGDAQGAKDQEEDDDDDGPVEYGEYEEFDDEDADQGDVLFYAEENMAVRDVFFKDTICCSCAGNTFCVLN
jgi:hypothetical protein